MWMDLKLLSVPAMDVHTRRAAWGVMQVEGGKWLGMVCLA